MRLQILITATLFAASPAWAINKCKGPDGKVTYQEAPCAASHTATEVKIAPTSTTGTSAGGKQATFSVLPLGVDVAKQIAAAGVQLAKNRLKDPDSAKFEGVRVLSFKAFGTSIEMTCGQLNAKNSYGGYVGSKPFWVYEGVFTETFDHYYPKDKSVTQLMGNIQTACLADGVAVQQSTRTTEQ